MMNVSLASVFGGFGCWSATRRMVSPAGRHLKVEALSCRDGKGTDRVGLVHDVKSPAMLGGELGEEFAQLGL